MNSEPSNINILSDRDAYYSILGYHYQFKLTFYHLLKDYNNDFPYSDSNKGGGTFIVEEGEDYKRTCTDGSVTYVQVKYNENKLNKYGQRKAILELYKNYLNPEYSNHKLVLAIYYPNVSNISDLIDWTFKYLDDADNKITKTGRTAGEENQTYIDLKEKLDEIERGLQNKEQHRIAFKEACVIPNDCPDNESLTDLITAEVNKTGLLPSGYSSEEFGKVLFVEFKEEYLSKTIKSNTNPQNVEFDGSKLKKLTERIQFIDYLKIIQNDFSEYFITLRNNYLDYFEDKQIDEDYREKICKNINFLERWFENKLKDKNNIISFAKMLWGDNLRDSEPDFEDVKKLSDLIKNLRIRILSFFERLIDISCSFHEFIDFDEIIKIEKSIWAINKINSNKVVILFEPTRNKGTFELSRILQRQEDKLFCPNHWLFGKIKDRNGEIINGKKIPVVLDQTHPFDVTTNEDITDASVNYIQIECMDCYNDYRDDLNDDNLNYLFNEGCK